MTSYFSVQIDDLQGVYSVKTYWGCFAVVVALSVLALFFFSRFLLQFWWWLESQAEGAMRGMRREKNISGVNEGLVNEDDETELYDINDDD